MKKSTIYDDILQELKEKGSFPIHNGYDQSTYQALQKLHAWDLIEPSPFNTKYTLTKEGHILLDSGKSFDDLVHPSWKTKTWNVFQKILGPGLVLAFRKLLGLI
ncbi:MAG TPA: hypothetical protein PKM27_16015 [Saprospiraceae bacterium]|nr:hypothetical protein [Saprospiraceae bacterium]HNT19902.1 hypothetical protein [Saprospiraceae bacterium]